MLGMAHEARWQMPARDDSGTQWYAVVREVLSWGWIRRVRQVTLVLLRRGMSPLGRNPHRPVVGPIHRPSNPSTRVHRATRVPFYFSAVISLVFLLLPP